MAGTLKGAMRFARAAFCTSPRGRCAAQPGAGADSLNYRYEQNNMNKVFDAIE
jgi:hypothetical protein